MSRFLIALTFTIAMSGMVQAGEVEAQQPQPQSQQAQDSIIGTITAMAANSVTVRSDGQQSMTVRVDALTRLLDERGMRIATRAEDLLGHLESGDRVVVNYRTGPAGEHVATSIEKWTAEREAPRAAAAGQEMQRQEMRMMQDSITGTITAMSGSNLTVRTDDQRSMTVRLDPQTRILDERGQRVATQAGALFGNLGSGDRVMVNYRTGEGATDRIAVSVERRATAQQARQDQRPQTEMQRQDALPRTSGALPLVAALGLIGLLGAGAMTAAARRGS